VRDCDSIRRYEIASDIDGDDVVIKINDNILSLHEPSDKNFTSPKFQFVFRDRFDLETFVGKLAREISYQKNFVERTDYKTNPCRLCGQAIDGRPQDLKRCEEYPRPHEQDRPDCPCWILKEKRKNDKIENKS